MLHHARASVSASSSESPQSVYLRINRRFLLLFPGPTEGVSNPPVLPPPPDTTGNLNAIVAEFNALRRFAGDTVDWVITVARFIFDPLGTSSLFTFTTNTLEWWLDQEMVPSQWRQVLPGEQLRATIYEFVPDNNAPVILTKISLRHVRSITTNRSTQQAAPFRNALLRRDQKCIINRSALQYTLIASHLIPRRLGDSGVQAILQRFTGPLNNVVQRYDPCLGVLLSATLDLIVDCYEMGFWNIGPVSLLILPTPLCLQSSYPQNQYIVHDFCSLPITTYGTTVEAPNEPICHGKSITLVARESVNTPPVGVFNWHYIQCVLKRFATPDYRNFANVNYYVQTFRTRDDEDDEDGMDFDDSENIANPPYPSYLIELAEAKIRQHLEDTARNESIVAWNSEVSAT